MSVEKNKRRDFDFIKYRKVMYSKFMQVLAQTFEFRVFEFKIK